MLGELCKTKALVTKLRHDRWNASQYNRFAAQRLRPYIDLLSQIPDKPVTTAVDMGCGSGAGAALVAQRWPSARVVGYDNSESMLASAEGHDASGVELRHADAEVVDLKEALGTAPDLIISNALLQWLPDHLNLISRWASMLAPGGTIAISVPANFDAPSHVVARNTAEALGIQVQWPFCYTLSNYATTLLDRRFSVTAWDSDYLQFLPVPAGAPTSPAAAVDPILEWMSGTTLRPVFEALGGMDTPESLEYLDKVRKGLAGLYGASPFGVEFPFKRRFVVGLRPA